MNKDNIYYSSVYFDCDSTLVNIEGIDELAAFYNKKEEVARLTEKAMSGQVPLEDVFALKLAMIRPARKDFDRLGKLYIKHVVDDVRDTISTLHFLKKTVIIMTGNFYPAVSQLSQYLGIEDQNVFANKIIFDEQDNYLTFDSKGPLSIAGGKHSLMLILKRENRKVVFVGDGLPDALTRPPVDLFIGYGGVVQRQKVRQKSDVYVTSKSMSVILPYILTKNERERISKSKYHKLLLKSEKLVTK